MSYRIALLGIYHESNTFVAKPTTIEDFHNGHFLIGEAIRSEYADAHHEIGGMLEVMDREGIEVLPVMFAEATPGGTISAATYNELLRVMMGELEKALPVDACFVVPHGAGVSEEYPDMDAHWMSQVRDRLGNKTPIVGTLDLHANVSPLMASSANALVSYKKNPHIDMRQTGKEAAEILVLMLKKNRAFQQVLLQVPLAISIEQQLTANEPCKSLYSYAAQLKSENEIISLSIQHGFPYADVKEMGTSIIAISDTGNQTAHDVARQLGDYILENREAFVGHKNDIPSSLAMIRESAKPVLLLDMGDNVGGGGPANNGCLLEALEDSKSFKYFVCIHDSEAVAQAEEYSTGDKFTIALNVTDKNGLKVIHFDVELLKITDGDFSEKNPRHGGQVNFRMGKTAVVCTADGSIIMLTSLRIVPFSLQQLISSGINPADFDAIVAKGVNAPVAAYSPVCPTIIQVNTPGVTQADMTLFDFSNRRKPLFPFER